jgi:lipopolysaccharide biosynthesis glycosyltransferase
MQIACIAEGAYLRHAGAMLHSVLQHSAPARAVVHVLHESAVSASDAAHLESVVGGFGGSVRWLRLADDTARAFPGGYFPRAVWFRVLLPELLPDLDRVLYLDADLIATDSLLPLWETPLGDHLLGAVTNPFYPFMAPYVAPALGIDAPEDYFNSGVLLFNLARMREEGTARKLVDYALGHPHLHYPDQDALNVVCRDRWLHLHPRWNLQSTFVTLAEGDLPLPAQPVREARAHPALVHFIGPYKPWTYMCVHSMRQLYFAHARATPWGEPPLEGRTLRAALLRHLPLQWIDRWMALERWALAKSRGARRRLRSALGN